MFEESEASDGSSAALERSEQSAKPKEGQRNKETNASPRNPNSNNPPLLSSLLISLASLSTYLQKRNRTP
jgi:CCR4-NOT transcriptional regulation complex NOT5 subunit